MFLHDLRLWVDPLARLAPESMAVDEWLLGIGGDPVLRVYRWKGEWGSIGYFDRLELAQQSFPGLPFVRRWTGGGTVDHRSDWAYTLVIPHAADGKRRLGGADSYREIHGALAQALIAEGRDLKLSCGSISTGAAVCFENPVCYDLVDASGRKLAGAGQRRSKVGLMHQGSVALPVSHELHQERAERFAFALAENWRSDSFEVPPSWLEMTVAQRYARPEWTGRKL